MLVINIAKLMWNTFVDGDCWMNDLSFPLKYTILFIVMAIVFNVHKQKVSKIWELDALSLIIMNIMNIMMIQDAIKHQTIGKSFCLQEF